MDRDTRMRIDQAISIAARAAALVMVAAEVPALGLMAEAAAAMEALRAGIIMLALALAADKLLGLARRIDAARRAQRAREVAEAASARDQLQRCERRRAWKDCWRREYFAK